MALATIAVLASWQTAHAGGKSGEGTVRYGKDYKGYLLRPPYFLPGLGWYTPPDFHDRSLYFGFHFREPGKPRVPGSRKPTVRLDTDHAEWCRARYASYRVSDNTFQPHNGLRQQCRSPYW